MQHSLQQRTKAKATNYQEGEPANGEDGEISLAFKRKDFYNLVLLSITTHVKKKEKNH